MNEIDFAESTNTESSKGPGEKCQLLSGFILYTEHAEHILLEAEDLLSLKGKKDHGSKTL